MIGLVVVSHSHALATAAVALASEMVPENARPAIAVAAGLDQTTFGTDAAAIGEAIVTVDSPDGVLVLLDLGSAILSAEMALEFVDPDVADRVRLSAAPLVEGLVAAVVTASTGASLDEVAAEASDGLLGKRDQLGVPAEAAAAGPESGRPGEVQTPCDSDPSSGSESQGVAGPQLGQSGLVLEFRTVIRNPHGLHARPAAYLVAGLRGLDATVQVSNATKGSGPVSAKSPTRVSTLGLAHGDTLVAEVAGPAAAAALQALIAMADADFGESTPVVSVSGPVISSDLTAPSASGEQVVIGPVHVVVDHVDTSGYVPSDDETARFDEARAKLSNDLARHTDGEQAAIFGAQSVLLDDPEISDAVHRRIAGGASAVEATETEFAEVSSLYEALDDPYLAERAQDVRSLSRQLRARLAGVDDSTQAPDEPRVLVVAELDAATAATLDTATCLGVVTTTGGATGHGVIVATSRGIPVLTGRSEAAGLAEGVLVGFDPRSHELWIDPNDALLADLRQRAAERNAADDEASRQAHEPAVTPGGRTILVEANVASLEDAHRGGSSGADGSGLVRTELLFCNLAQAPTAEHQAEVFVAIGQALGGRMITIRTWDVGGDKPLSFLPQDRELNPFLGERGVRTMTRVPELFIEQLRGIVLASRHVPVRVMFPMVTLPDEVRWAREQVDAVVAELGADPVKVGMMVEVPAAAVRSADFAGLVDFVSIGTNDLTQYTTATDRTNGRVAHLADATSSAVLDLIAMTCQGLPDVPVAVCGDLASDVTMTATLVRLGVTELSVRPPLVAVVKRAVRVG